jgi:hypothetical protein
MIIIKQSNNKKKKKKKKKKMRKGVPGKDLERRKILSSY